MNNLTDNFKNYELPFEVEPVIRLREAHRILRKRVMFPGVPRRTLLHYIEDGTLEGCKTKHGYWVVKISSFERFVKSLTKEGEKN
jgi:hypothetical protein